VQALPVASAWPLVQYPKKNPPVGTRIEETGSHCGSDSPGLMPSVRSAIARRSSARRRRLRRSSVIPGPARISEIVASSLARRAIEEQGSSLPARTGYPFLLASSADRAPVCVAHRPSHVALEKHPASVRRPADVSRSRHSKSARPASRALSTSSARPALERLERVGPRESLLRIADEVGRLARSRRRTPRSRSRRPRPVRLVTKTKKSRRKEAARLAWAPRARWLTRFPMIKCGFCFFFETTILASSASRLPPRHESRFSSSRNRRRCASRLDDAHVAPTLPRPRQSVSSARSKKKEKPVSVVWPSRRFAPAPSASPDARASRSRATADVSWRAPS